MPSNIELKDRNLAPNVNVRFINCRGKSEKTNKEAIKVTLCGGDC